MEAAGRRRVGRGAHGPAGPLDRAVLGRHQPLADRRAGPRDLRGRLLRRQRGRCPRSRSPSRSPTWSAACSPTRRSRPRSSRSSPRSSSSGNKREAFRLASTLIFLVTLVLTGAHRAVHPASRRYLMPLFVRLRRAAGPHRHPLADPVPDPGDARDDGDGRRDPEQLRPLRRLRASRRSSGTWRSSSSWSRWRRCSTATTRSTPTRSACWSAPLIQLAIPTWDLRHTPFKLMWTFDWEPRREARAAPDAAGHAEPRADQLQPADQQHLRLARSPSTPRRRSTRRFASTCCPRASSRWR